MSIPPVAYQCARCKAVVTDRAAHNAASHPTQNMTNRYDRLVKV